MHFYLLLLSPTFQFSLLLLYLISNIVNTLEFCILPICLYFVFCSKLFELPNIIHISYLWRLWICCYASHTVWSGFIICVFYAKCSSRNMFPIFIETLLRKTIDLIGSFVLHFLFLGKCYVSRTYMFIHVLRILLRLGFSFWRLPRIL